ncbi:MAG: hypothetical protein DMF58_07760 [Acidobacteria bacterium]|nr:MAG: hypothetical protein DMF58_07760 [Acidobacteriota bacterium]
MIRRLTSIAIVLLATAATAQQRYPGRPGPTPSAGFLAAQIDRMEGELRAKSAGVRRDAFIVSQLVAAVGELEDFQHTVALEKARDHVNAALKRASESPVAASTTFTAIQKSADLVDTAKRQGATADMPVLKRDLLKQNHFVQQVLFTELDDVRKDRQTLSDLQSRLSSITNDMDNALAEALGSTFDYFRAGGQ